MSKHFVFFNVFVSPETKKNQNKTKRDLRKLSKKVNCKL